MGWNNGVGIVVGRLIGKGYQGGHHTQLVLGFAMAQWIFGSNWAEGRVEGLGGKEGSILLLHVIGKGYYWVMANPISSHHSSR